MAGRKQERIIISANQVLTTAEDATIARISEALSAAYYQLERELKANWDIASDKSRLPNERSLILMRQIQKSLNVLDPKNPNTKALKKSMRELNAKATQLGFKLSDDLIKSIQPKFTPASAAELNLEAVKNAADSGYKRLLGHGETFANNVSSTVALSIATGQSFTRTARAMSGALAIARSRSEMLVRTESMLAMDQATRDRYQDHGIDLFERVATLDHRTCFPAFVEIETERGPVPISKVKAGDRVLTRHGFRKVLEVHSRNYRGKLTRVSAGSLSTVSTADHPFWTARGWIDAQEIKHGELIQTFKNQLVQVDSLIHFNFSKPNNSPSPSSQIFVFPFVPSLVSVPVCPVNFNRDKERRESKIDAPISHLKFLLKIQPQALKALPDSGFKHRFACEFPVAGSRAETTYPFVRRGNPEACGTVQTLNFSFGAVASFRAMSSFIQDIPELDAASTANDPSSCPVSPLTVQATKFITMLDRLVAFKPNTATLTSLSDSSFVIGQVAGSTAILLGPPGVMPRFSATSDTVKRFTFPLSLPHTGSRAILPFRSDTLITQKFSATSTTMNKDFHGCIRLEDDTNHDIKVFNLTVEDLPEFYADGILVHNCPYCAARAGNIYKIAEAAGAVLHASDRCFSSPILQEWIDDGLVDLEVSRKHRQDTLKKLNQAGGKPNYGLAPFEKKVLQYPPKPYWSAGGSVAEVKAPPIVAKPAQLVEVKKGVQTVTEDGDKRLLPPSGWKPAEDALPPGVGVRPGKYAIARTITNIERYTKLTEEDFESIAQVESAPMAQKPKKQPKTARWSSAYNWTANPITDVGQLLNEGLSVTDVIHQYKQDGKGRDRFVADLGKELEPRKVKTPAQYRDDYFLLRHFAVDDTDTWLSEVTGQQLKASGVLSELGTIDEETPLILTEEQVERIDMFETERWKRKGIAHTIYQSERLEMFASKEGEVIWSIDGDYSVEEGRAPVSKKDLAHMASTWQDYLKSVGGQRVFSNTPTSSDEHFNSRVRKYENNGFISFDDGHQQILDNRADKSKTFEKNGYTYGYNEKGQLNRKADGEDVEIGVTRTPKESAQEKQQRRDRISQRVSQLTHLDSFDPSDSALAASIVRLGLTEEEVNRLPPTASTLANLFSTAEMIDEAIRESLNPTQFDGPQDDED